jgi:hypothetical protein
MRGKSRLGILCLTVRKFRITKKKEWKNTRKLECGQNSRENGET